MHPLGGALPLLYVPALVTRGAFVAHWHSSAFLALEFLSNRRTLVPLSVSLWNDLRDSVFDSVELAGFKSQVKAFLFA